MDKNEAILLRLQALLATIEGVGVANVYRDRADLGKAKRPCLLLLDGLEERVSPLPESGRQVAKFETCIMERRPQIFVLQKDKPRHRSGEWGPEVAGWRADLLRAVFNDAQLLSLLGPNGKLIYLGSETDFQSGSTMEGTLRFDFAFRYVLNPADL